MRKNLIVLFTLMSVWLFASCANFFAPVMTGPDTDKSGQKGMSIVRVTVSHDGSLPKNLADSMFSDNTDSKSAFPSFKAETYDLVVRAVCTSETRPVINATNGNTSPSVPNGKVYEIAVPQGGIWKIEAFYKTKGENPVTVFSAEEGDIEITEITPVINCNLVLQPYAQAGKTGTVSLPVKIEPASIKSMKAEWKHYKSNESVKTRRYIPESGELVFDMKESAEASAPESGIYSVDFSFWSERNGGVLLYKCTEIINVFDSMCTDTWVKQYSMDPSYGDPHFAEEDSIVKMKISSDCLSKFQLTNIFVGKTKPEGGPDYFKDPSDSNIGTYTEPLKTLQKAVNIINTQNDGVTEYTIYLMDDYTATGALGEFDVPSIGINGYGNTLVVIKPTKKLLLNITGYGTKKTINANNKGRVMLCYLGTSNDSKITLKNLKITNGKTGQAAGSNGAGIYLSGIDMVLDNVDIIDNVIENSETARQGAGIYSSSANLTIKCGIISGNQNNSSGGNGGGIASTGSGTLDLGDSSAGSDVIIGTTSVYTKPNTAFSSGGGVYVSGNGVPYHSVTMNTDCIVGKENVISGEITEESCSNVANKGAGCYFASSNVELKGGYVCNGRVKLNGSQEGKGTGIFAGIYINISDSFFVAKNNDIYLDQYGNAIPSYVITDNVLTPPAANGNITAVLTPRNAATDAIVIRGTSSGSNLKYFDVNPDTFAIIPGTDSGNPVGKLMGVAWVCNESADFGTGTDDETADGTKQHPYKSINYALTHTTAKTLLVSGTQPLFYDYPAVKGISVPSDTTVEKILGYDTGGTSIKRTGKGVGSLLVNNKAKLVLENFVFDGNKTLLGRTTQPEPIGLDLANTTTLVNCKIINCSSEGANGTVRCSKDVTFDNCTIGGSLENSNMARYGGGIYVCANATVTLNKTEVSYCTANESPYYSGIYILKEGKAELKGGSKITGTVSNADTIVYNQGTCIIEDAYVNKFYNKNVAVVDGNTKYCYVQESDSSTISVSGTVKDLHIKNNSKYAVQVDTTLGATSEIELTPKSYPDTQNPATVIKGSGIATSCKYFKIPANEGITYNVESDGKLKAVKADGGDVKETYPSGYPKMARLLIKNNNSVNPNYFQHTSIGLPKGQVSGNWLIPTKDQAVTYINSGYLPDNVAMLVMDGSNLKIRDVSGTLYGVNNSFAGSFQYWQIRTW